MAPDVRLSARAANAAAEAIAALLSGGRLCIYAGQRPAGSDKTPGGKLLAEVPFGPAIGRPAGAGIVAVQLSTSGAEAVAAGQAAWYRCLASNGAAVLDGAISTAGGSLVLSRTDIEMGSIVTLSEFTVQMPLEVQG